jgi:2-amino-4-hydroxy-6-hydroxymethyldihydropteridine diphosphokinase
MDVYLGLGTNQGNKYENIQNAVNAISIECGDVIDESSTYESPSWGFKTEGSFYNSVVLIQTKLLPEELLHSCKKIEIELGRKKKTKLGYESRIIDIDILLYDNITLDLKDLKIPHPLIDDRMFVLKPLVELLVKKDVDLEVFYKLKLSKCDDQSILKIIQP